MALSCFIWQYLLVTAQSGANGSNVQ